MTVANVVEEEVKPKQKGPRKLGKRDLRGESAKYHVKLKFTSPILGSAPANKDVYAKFVATKKVDATPESIERETETIPPIPFDEQTGRMVFRVDPKTNAKIFLMHQIKGFLKESTRTVLGKEITAFASKIDRLIHVSPERIPLTRNGKPVTEADGPNERPLRAQTPQGPRVTLVSSEELADCTVEFTLEVLPLAQNDFDDDILDYIFQYGAYSGISQWRSAGYGRFDFEIRRLDENAKAA